MIAAYKARQIAIKCKFKMETKVTVIAMTRELGCRGIEVATGLADRLGLRIIDSEIVANTVAARLGIEESSLLRHVDGSASIFERWLIDRRKLQRYTSEENPTAGSARQCPDPGLGSGQPAAGISAGYQREGVRNNSLSGSDLDGPARCAGRRRSARGNREI
jgi:hypothetical protein